MKEYFLELRGATSMPRWRIKFTSFGKEDPFTTAKNILSQADLPKSAWYAVIFDTNETVIGSVGWALKFYDEHPSMTEEVNS